MAKKIEWTETSLRDRQNIYRYWSDRNKSGAYSEKLEVLFNEAAKLISQFPEPGTETDFPELRIKVVKHYKLFYLNREDAIQIIRIWDPRRNPDSIDLS
jgi:plasmid stabilization system protein ParE